MNGYCKGCENRMSMCDCNEPSEPQVSIHDKPQAPESKTRSSPREFWIEYTDVATRIFNEKPNMEGSADYADSIHVIEHSAYEEAIQMRTKQAETIVRLRSERDALAKNATNQGCVLSLVKAHDTYKNRCKELIDENHELKAKLARTQDDSASLETSRNEAEDKYNEQCGEMNSLKAELEQTKKEFAEDWKEAVEEIDFVESEKRLLREQAEALAGALERAKEDLADYLYDQPVADYIIEALEAYKNTRS